MQRLSLEEALLIAERIDGGLENRMVRDTRFEPLRRQPFLAELFLNLMRALDTGLNVEFHWHNFMNVCAIMCPEFISILTAIDLPELDIIEASKHMNSPEPDILSHV